MDNVTYRILNNDKRYHHINKIQNYIINTSYEQNWHCEINTQNSSTSEIILEKDFERGRVSFRITTMLIGDKIIIGFDKTSFDAHGIKIFLIAFLEKMDKNLYKKVEKSKIKDNSKNSVDYILNDIFKNFHRSAQQLLKRHDNRETLRISNEYDVQDYLHSLLLLFFDDVKDEDPLPKKVGASSRGDFFLPLYHQ